MSGKLYVIATPIGNLADITLRAIETLKQVDLIACEDTRVTKKLTDYYQINSKLISYHAHSGPIKTEKIISALKSDQSVALVTDAGTPGISDPGQRLVAEVINQGISIETIPGPSALAAALSVCHFDIREFVFYGFLPHKKGRQTKLKEIATEHRAVVLYESVYRIKKLLKEILETRGDSEVCVCRELTKKYETVYRGKISEVADKIIEKGEFVLILEGLNGKK